MDPEYSKEVLGSSNSAYLFFESLHTRLYTRGRRAIGAGSPALKQVWLSALEQAEAFTESRPPDEFGCLYYSPGNQKFVMPKEGDEVVPYYGHPGGGVTAR